jgi:hypothetical protein
MDHAGLSDAALAIERSGEFKRAFRETVSVDLGFDGPEAEILESREVGEHLAAYLETFGPDGHPPEAATAGFVTAELRLRAGSEVAAGEQVRDTCVWIPPKWRTIGGYVVTKDGQPWTIESAVAEYESRHGKIEDPAVRAELAAIRVYVQIEWEIAL